jgi:hypothetical protein
MSAQTPAAAINVKALKDAVTAIVDHVADDLALESIPLEEKFYWTCSAAERYANKPLENLELGSLIDDLDFSTLVRRGESADVASHCASARLPRRKGKEVTPFVIRGIEDRRAAGPRGRLC